MSTTDSVYICMYTLKYVCIYIIHINTHAFQDIFVLKTYSGDECLKRKIKYIFKIIHRKHPFFCVQLKKCVI